MSANGVFIDAGIADDARRARLFAGDVFLFSPTPASLALVEFGREALHDAFAPEDPYLAHRHLSVQQVNDILVRFKPAFIHHPRCKEIIPQLLAELGCDVDKTYFDVPRIRSAYPGNFFNTGIAFAFPPHRDTWYSAPPCQINWWLPMHEIVPENAMGFYPDLFDRPVENNSELYNYYEWNAVRGTRMAQPMGRNPITSFNVEGTCVKYLPKPGGIIMFSAAQLHQTMPNTTDRCRYSIDFRTVHADDAIRRAGAPNVDSRCTGSAIRDYLRASNPSLRLPPEVVEAYNDGTEGVGVLVHRG